MKIFKKLKRAYWLLFPPLPKVTTEKEREARRKKTAERIVKIILMRDGC